MMCQKSFARQLENCLKKIVDLVVFIILRKVVEDVAIVYATLIIKGRKSFADVPDTLKEQVRQILIDLDVPELAE